MFYNLKSFFKVVHNGRLNTYVHMYIIIYLCNVFHDGMWNACRSRRPAPGECEYPLCYTRVQRHVEREFADSPLSCVPWWLVEHDISVTYLMCSTVEC